MMAMVRGIVMLLAVVLIGWQGVRLVSGEVLSTLDGVDYVWAGIVGLQIFVMKKLRIPIAPGKWIDFTYVPIWVMAFTLPAPISIISLTLFSALVYIFFQQQFTCQRELRTYFFHLSYQVVLFTATVESFWFSMRNFSLEIGSLSLTGTLAMFVSMFGLMFADTILGGLIQWVEGQRNSWKEWKMDYGRITLVQTLLSSIAMLFTVLYLTGHPIQLTVVYGFTLLGIWIVYRISFRQDDYLGLVRSMSSMVELKDTYTKNHSASVGHYSTVLGQMLGLPASRLDRLHIAAQLHDIGKIGIADEVLKKQGSLTNEEYETMKDHALFGERVLEPLRSMKQEAHIVGRHHEHINGKGYPRGLTLEAIPLESRIISIADAYHAMISNRPYRKGLGVEEAVRRLQQSKGTQFDPYLVDLFTQYTTDPSIHTHRFRPFCLVH